MAFCWAVEPSAVRAALPPQSAAAEDEDPDPDAVLEDVPELLSLPHAVIVIVASAAADRVVPSTLPKRLSFTDPTFDFCLPQDSTATYAALVDGSLTKSERAVNRLSDYTAERLTQPVRDVRGEDPEIEPLVGLHGR